MTTAIYSPTRNISHPSEKFNQTRPRLHLVQHALHMVCDSNNSRVIFRIYRRKIVIDRQHNGRSVSLEVPFRIGWTLYQRQCQHDGFATLDGVEAMYNRFGETFHDDATESAPSTKDWRMRMTEYQWRTGRHKALWRAPDSLLRNLPRICSAVDRNICSIVFRVNRRRRVGC